MHGHASNAKGKKQSRTYNSWRSMIQRCRNSNHPHNTTYKAVGYCEKWSQFSEFLEDMGERPEGASLDRIDTTKGYSKDNCRWASPAQQMRNRKDNSLTIDIAQTIRRKREEGMQIKDIANDLGVSSSSVKNVLYKGYWL